MPGGSAQPGEIPQAEQQLQKGHQADLLWIIGQIRDSGVDNIFISRIHSAAALYTDKASAAGTVRPKTMSIPPRSRISPRVKNKQPAAEFHTGLAGQRQTTGK